MLFNVVLLGLFASDALAAFTKGTTLLDIQSLKGRQVAPADYVPAGTCAKTPGVFTCGGVVNNQELCYNPSIGQDCCNDECKDALSLSEAEVCLTKLSIQIVAKQTHTASGTIIGAVVLWDSSPADCAAQIIAAGLTSSIPASLTTSRTSTASNKVTTTARSSSTGSVRSNTTTTSGVARASGTGVNQVANTTRPGVAKFTGGANSQNVIGGSGALLMGFCGIMGYAL
ncbi:MAG: hypothetical protein M1835_002708 [Candelina submexicana]|nr:MAG: hypothetical protein M1835_002708 [Candelina submexicana]